MKYKMVFETADSIDSIVYDNKEGAIADAEDTLVEWACEKMRDWAWDKETSMPAPTDEQIESWDYMIYNCGCFVVEYDEETGEEGDIDDPLWPTSQAQLDEIGWMLWEDYVKKMQNN